MSTESSPPSSPPPEKSEAAVKNTAPKEKAKETPKQTRGSGSKRFKRVVFGTSAALVFFTGFVYVSDTRASIHKYVLVPIIRFLYPDAEDAHHAGVDTLKNLYKYGLHPRERAGPDGDGSLTTEVNIYSIRAP